MGYVAIAATVGGIVLACQASALTIADGQYHLITEPTVHAPHQIRNSPEGEPTTVEVGVDGLIWGELHAYDESEIVLSGGIVWGLFATHDRATGLFAGGENKDDVKAYDSSVLTITGGHPRNIYAYDDSTIVVVGTSFEISGRPVGYGSVADVAPGQFNARLTGVLADGTYLDIYYGANSAPYAQYYTGNLILVPEPSTFFSALVGLTVIAWYCYARV